MASSHAGESPDAAAEAVTWIYQAHVLSLTRLAHVMLGDRAAAEDVLRYYLDLPDAEIAAVMGIGASSVRSAARRAGQSLRRIMRGWS